MKVDRCICVDISFATLKPIGESLGGSFRKLKAATGCCTGCAACEPYIRLMLKTGQTEFALLADDVATEIRLVGRAEDLESKDKP